MVDGTVAPLQNQHSRVAANVFQNIEGPPFKFLADVSTLFVG
jgi:hypothetical protein